MEEKIREVTGIGNPESVSPFPVPATLDELASDPHRADAAEQKSPV
jgi:hypothetical protein